MNARTAAAIGADVNLDTSIANFWSRPCFLSKTSRPTEAMNIDTTITDIYKLMEIASAFRVEAGAKIIEEVRHAASMWPTLAQGNDVSKKTRQAVGDALQKIDRRF